MCLRHIMISLNDNFARILHCAFSIPTSKKLRQRKLPQFFYQLQMCAPNTTGMEPMNKAIKTAPLERVIKQSHTDAYF